MVKGILKKLRELPDFPTLLPRSYIFDPQLIKIRERIRRLKYSSFLKVFNYVESNPNLPRDFKEELEAEYYMRGLPRDDYDKK
jgi:hypothetical protein